MMTWVKPWISAANGITLLRILGTLGLLILMPLTPEFYLVYTLTGLTDALDGWVARKTGTAGPLGARLDSWADLLFYGVVIVRLFPVLFARLPQSIWWAILAVAGLRIAGYLTAAVKYHAFAALHTCLNKLTGLGVFLIPYVLPMSFAVGYCWGICAVAGIAAGEELAIHMKSKRCKADIASILQREKEV